MRVLLAMSGGVDSSVAGALLGVGGAGRLGHAVGVPAVVGCVCFGEVAVGALDLGAEGVGARGAAASDGGRAAEREQQEHDGDDDDDDFEGGH